jgi:biotin operon repressor
MEDNQQESSDDGLLAAAALRGWSQEQVLVWRWERVTRHKVLRQILDLLSQQPDRWMYQAEIARALKVQREWVHREMQHFKWAGVVEVEHRGSRTYYKLQPGMTEQYQQWLASQQSSDSQS